MIYFSTGSFNNAPATYIAQQLYDAGVTAVELSGGKFELDYYSKIKELQKLGISIRLHNYYPVPKVPFVMNLASPNGDIRSKSISLATEALEISSYFDFKYYAVHAGMRVDPEPEELGLKFKARSIVDEDKSMELFMESMRSLNSTAKKLNVELLIENHASSSENLKVYSENVFLLSSLEQIESFYKHVSTENRLLLDVGHLNVSSYTLGFDKFKAFERLNEWVGGYHLHDNNSIHDQHNSFDKTAWFIPCLKGGVSYITCELNDFSTFSILQARQAIEYSELGV